MRSSLWPRTLRIAVSDGISWGVEVPRGDRLPAPRTLLVVAAALAVISALAMVAIDRPLATFLGGYQALDFWSTGLDVLEYAIGLPLLPWISGIVLVAAMIATTAVPRWRRYAPAFTWIAGVHILSRIATTELKDATGRLRPFQWLAKGGGDVETFGWIKAHSFPSGHVTLFASIAIPVAVVVAHRHPRIAIAVLVPVVFPMVARVVQSQHFISDVTASVALICLIAWLTGWLVRPLRSPR
jgi:membrane-associated phospholipid phosphatase